MSAVGQKQIFAPQKVSVLVSVIRVTIAIGKITSLSAHKGLGNNTGESVGKPVVERGA